MKLLLQLLIIVMISQMAFASSNSYITYNGKSYKLYKLSSEDRTNAKKIFLTKFRKQIRAKKYRNYMNYNSHYKPTMLVINMSKYMVPRIENNAGGWNRGKGNDIYGKSHKIVHVYSLNQFNYFMNEETIFDVYVFKYNNDVVYVMKDPQ